MPAWLQVLLGIAVYELAVQVGLGVWRRRRGWKAPRR